MTDEQPSYLTNWLCCGDRRKPGESHDCWLNKKMGEQETFPAPIPTDYAPTSEVVRRDDGSPVIEGQLRSQVETYADF